MITTRLRPLGFAFATFAVGTPLAMEVDVSGLVVGSALGCCGLRRVVVSVSGKGEEIDRVVLCAIQGRFGIWKRWNACVLALLEVGRG